MKHFTIGTPNRVLLVDLDEITKEESGKCEVIKFELAIAIPPRTKDVTKVFQRFARQWISQRGDGYDKQFLTDKKGSGDYLKYEDDGKTSFTFRILSSRVCYSESD
ncbi:MAG: hypothetical protein JXR73_15540 [Candidatus Omnitrophica bacterium]|nr:hypothetical protein [Candidatus Omnitrophota bacterium]